MQPAHVTRRYSRDQRLVPCFARKQSAVFQAKIHCDPFSAIPHILSKIAGDHSTYLQTRPDSSKSKKIRGTKIQKKTYNRRDSQMVTHSSTSRPVQCLCMAERTGCPIFTDLWSYVPTPPILVPYICHWSNASRFGVKSIFFPTQSIDAELRTPRPISAELES